MAAVEGSRDLGTGFFLALQRIEIGCHDCLKPGKDLLAYLHDAEGFVFDGWEPVCSSMTGHFCFDNTYTSS